MPYMLGLDIQCHARFVCLQMEFTQHASIHIHFQYFPDTTLLHLHEDYTVEACVARYNRH